MDWSVVTKKHIEQAIKKFIEEKPEYAKPRSYYLIYKGEKFPSKYIRRMAYSIATGKEVKLSAFNGGIDTVNFFKKYGYTVEQDNSEALYDIEQIRARISELGIEGKNIASNMVQLGVKSTTICRTKTNEIILYVTDSDFDKIINSDLIADNIVLFSDTSVNKDELVANVEKTKTDNVDAVICSRMGNKIINASSAGSYNPNEIRLYTNDNFDVVLEIVTGQKMSSGKFSVNDAVWIAAALLTVEAYSANPDISRNDVYFKQADIVHRAQLLAKGKVDSARVSWWLNADNEKATKNYLRADQNRNSSTRRLSAMNEFSEKSYPTDLDMDDELSMNGAPYSMRELFKFVNEQYPEILKKVKGESSNMVGLNTILYGPPGTGKTYNTVVYAVAICGEDGTLEEVQEKARMDYKEVKARYDELKAAGRIAFTTFHQSYGYEEFIEGIRPVISKKNEEFADDENKLLKYKIEPGIFKKFCDDAKKPEVKTDKFGYDKEAVVWKVTVRPEVQDDCFDNGRVRIDWGIDSNGAVQFVNSMKKGDIILTTDGNRRVINGIAVVKSDEAYELPEADNDKTTREVDWLADRLSEDITGINDNKILHRMTCAKVPNMAVADIVALAMQKNTALSGTQIKKNEKPYVFIIDEINRGNISKIFGELITLIEDTKRLGKDEAASAVLPYSNEEFSVPANVFILGTMNTADRSISLMDTALRRRFDFIEMMPEENLLKGVVVSEGNKSVDVGEMLDVINKRIEFLFDREHTIGHAFFMKLKTNAEARTVDTLASIFKKSVIPLLQEYFYEDYEKIRLVLGDTGKEERFQFVTREVITPSTLFRGHNRLEKSEKYNINCSDDYDVFMHIESYTGIMESAKTEE